MKITIIILSIIIILITAANYSYQLRLKMSEPCLKFQTNAIEINNELKDYLICTSGNLPVILKEYEKN